MSSSGSMDSFTTGTSSRFASPRTTAPPLPALSDVQSIILDELIHMRQMMANHFAQVDRRLIDLESTIEAMFDEV